MKVRYVTIDPGKREIKAIDVEDYLYALDKAGLAPGRVDHGVVEIGISIVVDEFSLFVPPAQQRYFAIGTRLFAGRALLYAFDDGGDTVDLNRIPDVKFFDSAKAVESAIEIGTIERPRNTLIQWVWPEPKPDVFEG